MLVVLHLRRPGRALALGALALAAFLTVQRPDLWSAARAPGDADRLRIMRTSLSLAVESPLLGIGFGINNLRRRFPDRYEQLYGERLFRFHSANQIVDLLVGTGVIGTALAGWWAVRLASQALRHVRTAAAGAPRLCAAGHLATLVAIALMSLVEPPLYHGKLVPILFLVIAYGQLGGRPDADSWRRGPG
jgi:O-antigen ligase